MLYGLLIVLYIDDSFPSVVCFRCRNRPLYKREREKFLVRYAQKEKDFV